MRNILPHLLYALVILTHSFNIHASSPVYVALAQIEQQEISESAYVIASVRHLPSVDFYASHNGTIDFTIAATQQNVQQGQTILAISSEKSNSAIEEAKIAKEHAQANYDRDYQLYKKQFIAKTKLEQSARLLKQAQAKLANTTKSFNDAKFIAPFSGAISAINLQVGDRVNPGQFLATIIGSKSTELTAYLPQRLFNIRDLKTSWLLPSGKIIHPQLSSTSPDIDVHSGNVKAIFSSPYIDEIAHKSYVELQLQINAHQALTIPEKAIMIDEQGTYIFTTSHDNTKAVRVNIKRGTRIPPMIEIIAHQLKAGDNIVIEGMHKLEDNTSIISIKD